MEERYIARGSSEQLSAVKCSSAEACFQLISESCRQLLTTRAYKVFKKNLKPQHRRT